MLANEPVPLSLLISIRRARFSSFPTGLRRPNMFGWGPFHLGFASSTDPEVGRCCRTDLKKWQCSRDVVPDSVSSLSTYQQKPSSLKKACGRSDKPFRYWSHH